MLNGKSIARRGLSGQDPTQKKFVIAKLEAPTRNEPKAVSGSWEATLETSQFEMSELKAWALLNVRYKEATLDTSHAEMLELKAVAP